VPSVVLVAMSSHSADGPVRPVRDKYALHVTDRRTDRQKDIAIA